MKNVMHNLFKKVRGAVAVEYALIVPFITLLIIGIADFGMFMRYSQMLQDISREAAQYVVQGGKPEDLQAHVFTGSAMADAAAANGTTVTFTTAKECACANSSPVACDGTCGSNDYVRTFFSVTVQSTYKTILPYPGIPDSRPMTGYSRLQYRG